MKSLTKAASGRISRITVHNHYQASVLILPFDKMAIEKILLMMLHHPRLVSYKKISSIDFHILDDAHIARANKLFMSLAGPSNILSFPGDMNLPGAMLLSADTFERECRLYGQDRKEYFVYLLSHALGHLAGLEHGREMYSLCEELASSVLYELPCLDR